MDPHEHLRSQIVPPGSNLYYALLFASPRDRRPLCAVAAWQQEARLLAFAPRDRDVALARIAWWQEEVRHLRAGSPRHPVARALAGDGCASSEAANESVRRMLDTVQRLVLAERAMEEEELWQHCDALGSEGEKMIADALAPAHQGAPGVFDELGRGLEMLELTRPPPGHPRITPRMVPIAHEQALREEPGNAPPGRCNPAMRALLRERAARARRLLGEALRQLAEAAEPPERSRVVLARLALLHLGILSRNGYRRWDTGPSPLRKLWTAWRAAQRCP